MSYLGSNLIFSLKNYVKNVNKPIKKCHVENVILGKDYILGATSSLFHAFTPWFCG
jgi:hypothetical protein